VIRLPQPLRIVLRETKVNILLTIEYRASTLVLMLNTFVGPTIALLVWLAVSAHSAGGANTLPLSRSQLVTYFVLMSLVSMLTGVWISEYLAADIRSGELSKYLMRPAPVMAGHIGLVFRHEIHLPRDPLVWALLALALALAGALSFLIDYLVGSLAFWLQAVSGLLALEALIAGLLAGRLVPLALFPPELAPLLAAQPWRYTLSFPLEIATGALTPDAIAFGLALQVSYVVAAALGVRVVWRYGLRSYAATGG
jgi:ABC-2 type transport system permease protein